MGFRVLASFFRFTHSLLRRKPAKRHDKITHLFTRFSRFFRFTHSPIDLFTCFILVVAAHQSWAAPYIAGRAETITGTAIIEKAGVQENLKAGDPVFVQDRIVTGADGSVEIVLVDQSRIKLAPDTSLEITGYRYDPAGKIRYGLISLIIGKARFAVQEFQEFQEFNDRRFCVQTRTALVASRDTDFIVAYDSELPRDEVCRDGLTNALCLEDSILVSSLEFLGKPMLLSTYMVSQVCGPNLPAPPRFVTGAEFARILAGLDRIGNKKTVLPDLPENPTDCLPNPAKSDSSN